MKELEKILQSHKDKLAASLGCDGSLDVLMLNAAERIIKNKSVRSKIWDVVGECGNGVTDRQKINEIESILLDSEEL